MKQVPRKYFWDFDLSYSNVDMDDIPKIRNDIFDKLKPLLDYHFHNVKGV